MAARHTTSNRRLPTEKKASQVAVLHSPKKSKFDDRSPFLAPELKGAGFHGPGFQGCFFGCSINITHHDLDKFD